MNLYLFGAGASYGSECVSPHPPPMGAGLFAALEAEFPHWANLPEDAKTEFKRDGLFEPGFDFVRQHYPTEISRELLVEMALYFCRFSPVEGNKYCDIARRLNTDDVIATTNYDFLIEPSISKLGKSFCYGQGDGEVSLLKPHGSPNFIPNMGNIWFGTMINTGTGAYVEAPLKFLVNMREIKDHLKSYPPYPPAISLYN